MLVQRQRNYGNGNNINGRSANVDSVSIPCVRIYTSSKCRHKNLPVSALCIVGTTQRRRTVQLPTHKLMPCLPYSLPCCSWHVILHAMCTVRRKCLWVCACVCVRGSGTQWSSCTSTTLFSHYTYLHIIFAPWQNKRKTKKKFHMNIRM